MTQVEKLLAISSEALALPAWIQPAVLGQTSQGLELFGMLQLKNGLYAFESALHVFPLEPGPDDEIGLEAWNSEFLWRNGYGNLANGLFFFAEDVFQDQFCISPNGIQKFDSETGATSFLSDSIENWAKLILSDYKLQTAYPLAQAWQAANGPLPQTRRLAPKIPFVLGGEYSLENFWVTEPVEGMRAKANIAVQIKDLPNGAKVKLRIEPRDLR